MAVASGESSDNTHISRAVIDSLTAPRKEWMGEMNWHGMPTCQTEQTMLLGSFIDIHVYACTTYDAC